MADLTPLQGVIDDLVAKMTVDKNNAVAAVQQQLDLANQTIGALTQQIADLIDEAVAIARASIPS